MYPTLRLPIGILSCVAMLVAQTPSAFAQNSVSRPAQQATLTPAPDATPSPAILDAFKAYPKGGDELSKLIEELIVNDPQLAPGLAKYVQMAPDLNKEQRMAAFRGLAAGLNRLKIQAADLGMPVKAPPPAPPPPPLVDYTWLALLGGAALIGGLICIAACQGEEHPIPRPVSP